MNAARKVLGQRGLALRKNFCQQKARSCSAPLTLKALVEINATAIK